MRSSSLRCFAALSVLVLAGIPLLAQRSEAAPAPTAVINDYANGNTGDGTLEYGLMQASDGNFYMTSGGPTIILRVTPSTSTTGTLSTLAGQLTAGCGTSLYGNLIEAADGNLYGFTLDGSTGNNGVFFQYNIATRTCTPLYSISNPTDGYSAQHDGGLTYGSDGNFYGMFYGYGPHGYGTVYRITPAGVFTVLYAFTGGTDGGNPTGRMIEASDGNWYGVTSTGGSGANQGVYFQLVPGVTTPWVETPLYNISCSTGCTTDGPIVEGPDSELYGAFYSGDIDGDGSIFQADFQGDFLGDFVDLPENVGELPQGVFLAGDGNLYIPLLTGGYGYLIEAAPGTGTVTQLASFAISPAPQNPDGPLIQGADGNFYGTTESGGTKSLGAIYQAVVTPAVTPAIQVSLSSNTTSGSPVTVSWQVNNATSKTARNCYLYTQEGGGTFTGKATGTQSGAVFSGSTSVTATATGTYTYAVECAGSYAGISPTLTVTGLAAAATKTVLAVSPNPVSIGSNVTLTATVTRTSESGTPTGSVSFEYQGLVLATVTLNTNGVAVLTANTGTYGPATYPVTAHYNPDSQDAASVSNTVNVVLKYGTKTTLTVSPTTITVPGNATITVHVTQNTGTGTPTGTITVYANKGAVISNYPLTNGSATITAPTTGFPDGTYSITAGYNGASAENTSTSSAVNVTLN